APPKLPHREKAAPLKVEKKEKPDRPAADKKPPVKDQISEPLDEKMVRRVIDDEAPPKTEIKTTPRDPDRLEKQPAAPIPHDTGVVVPEFRPILAKSRLRLPGRMPILKAPTRVVRRSPAPEAQQRKKEPPKKLDRQLPVSPASIIGARAEDVSGETPVEVRPALEIRPQEPSPPAKQPVQRKQYIMPLSRKKTIQRQHEPERVLSEVIPLISRRRTPERKPASQDLFIGPRRIEKRVQRKVQSLPQPLQQPKRDIRSIGEKITRPVVQRQVSRESPVDRAADPVSKAVEDLAAVRGTRAVSGSAQTIRRMPEETSRHTPPSSPAQDMPIVQPSKPPVIKETIQREIGPGASSQETQMSADRPPDESFEWAPEEPISQSIPDLATLARQVFPIIRRMLAQEKERSLGRHF
ncbi:MAG: hypothetical protein MUO76_02160, partial [Anaerolineaceae bacterium]|nr:hypothetical protein [Anaerolineaceae bacterium]